jgi:hypothetical protein
VYALALATAAAASTRGSKDSQKVQSPVAMPELFRGDGIFTAPNGLHGRVVRSLNKLFEGGGFFPPFDGGDGGGGGGGGEKFEFLDADSYVDFLEGFANGAVVRKSERLARISAEDYIECLEKEQERTIRMQEDRQRVRLEKSTGFWEGGAVPECAFIAMRKEEDRKKVTAVFSLEQQESSNYRTWLIRFTTGDPTGIAPRLADSEDPWLERYKLFSWLANNHQMRLYVEQRYYQRDFWYWKSDEFDL